MSAGSKTKVESADNGKSLVIVESPAKARTINRYLGRNYKVRASMGHVRDLPVSSFGVEIERDFAPTYRILPNRKRVVDELKQEAKQADQVYLATDLDREGEAIAWHLVKALGLSKSKVKRVMFNEITKRAIRQAFEHPLEIDPDKVNAQQARRILDRIVGYELSPLLWKKIARGLSAGRVQSVAVRLIVEREREIEKFVPEEFWKIAAVLYGGEERERAKAQQAYAKHQEEAAEKPDSKRVKQLFERHHLLKAELFEYDGEKFKASNQDQADQIVAALRAGPFIVAQLTSKDRLERPSAPFTTATLQQQAATRLKFSAARTMRVAQQLYEGVDLGPEGSVALITYMRTDSTHLAPEAVGAARNYVEQQFGNEYLPERPNVYTAKGRAQQAHEAVRPTDVARRPEDVKQYLKSDQYRLYELIWKRFLACQMAPARWTVTEAVIEGRGQGHVGRFKAVGRRLVFPGFLALLPERLAGADILLPELVDEQDLGLIDLRGTQHFTQPPPRYTEASLVRALEAQGIGRPSTYAAIISTIQDRGYVKKQEGKFNPTDLGGFVTDQLVEHFPRIMDVKFTSHMEDQLDKIEEAHLDWVAVLKEFYGPFKESLDQALENMRKEAQESPYSCDKCGKPMVYRWTKTGRFLGCSGYPECENTRPVDEKGRLMENHNHVTEHKCPKCGKPMALRQSQYGSFLGCTGYPECQTTMPCDKEGNLLEKVKPDAVNLECPECGKPMVAKRGRGAKGGFLGCSSYPQCRHTEPIPDDIAIDWPEPEQTDMKCPKCGKAMILRESRYGRFLGCSGYPKCRTTMPCDKEGNPLKKVKPDEIDLKCSECGKPLVAKRGKGAKGGFLGCSGYPECRHTEPIPDDVAIDWPEPKETDIKCPNCGKPMILRSSRRGQFLGCKGYPKCKTTQQLPKDYEADSQENAGP